VTLKRNFLMAKDIRSPNHGMMLSRIEMCELVNVLTVLPEDMAAISRTPCLYTVKELVRVARQLAVLISDESRGSLVMRMPTCNLGSRPRTATLRIPA
jgi:hypothetical protein